MKLLSDRLCTALCFQIGHEQYNANLYLHIAGFLKGKGLDNIASIFEEQWEEELKHSKIFFDLIADLNGEISIPAIQEVAITYSSILEIANAFMEREVVTTKSIEEIRDLAISEGNGVVEQRCREMIEVQQKEYGEATTFQDRASLLSDGDSTSWWRVALWDASLK